MTRRIINSFNPRLTIPTVEMSEHPNEYALYCLPVDGANALRRIIAYLNREVTYFYEVIDSKTYLGPTQEELENYTDLSAETEDSLMTPCDFTLIVEAIDRNTTAVTALQCICVGLTRSASGGAYGSDITEYLAAGSVIATLTQPDETILPQIDAAACAIAQLYYQFAFEIITETVLPAAASTFDTLIPILAGIIAGIASGGLAAIAMYAVAELIQELIELAYVVSEENYRNWLLSVKDDWVCQAYAMLKEGADASAIASSIWEEVIEPSETISYGDKLVTRLFGGVLAVLNAKGAYTEDTVWAQENVTPGYCEVCPEPPDPECVILDCDADHWSGDPPGVIGCTGGWPYAQNAFPIRWTEPAPTQPTGDFRVEIDWTGQGDTGNATLGAALWSKDTDTQIALAPQAVQPVGERTVSSWDVSSGGTIGEELQISLAQVGWFGVVHSYCIREIP